MIKRVLSVDNEFTRWLKKSDRRIEWLEEEHRVVSRRIWCRTDTIRRAEQDIVELKAKIAELNEEDGE